jgi:hypothetical protein
VAILECLWGPVPVTKQIDPRLLGAIDFSIDCGFYSTSTAKNSTLANTMGPETLVGSVCREHLKSSKYSSCIPRTNPFKKLQWKPKIRNIFLNSGASYQKTAGFSENNTEVQGLHSMASVSTPFHTLQLMNAPLSERRWLQNWLSHSQGDLKRNSSLFYTSSMIPVTRKR